MADSTEKSSKRIVHVFSTFVLGGPQRRTIDIFHALPERFKHFVFSIDNNFSAREALSKSAPVEFCEVKKNGGRVDRAFLRKSILDKKPDLIITYNWGATEAIQSLLFHKSPPMLHAQDGFGPDEAKLQIPRRLWARRFFYRFAQAVVVPSRTLERIAVEKWWLAPRRVLYIPNGIDIHKYSVRDAGIRNRFREQYTIPKDAVLIVMVAHLRGEKAPDRLLRAFAAAAVPESFLMFVGDGPERSSLETLALQLNITNRIRFAGHIPEPVAAYQAADIFALSSNTEQMPISVLEAMAGAMPIVSTDVGDVAAMAAPANRNFIIPLGDETGYAAALRTLLQNGELRERVGVSNRGKCVSQYSLEQQNNAYRDLYDRFAQHPRLAWRSEHFRN